MSLPKFGNVGGRGGTGRYGALGTAQRSSVAASASRSPHGSSLGGSLSGAVKGFYLLTGLRECSKKKALRRRRLRGRVVGVLVGAVMHRRMSAEVGRVDVDVVGNPIVEAPRPSDRGSIIPEKPVFEDEVVRTAWGVLRRPYFGQSRIK